ncbi:alpha-mannosidase [Heterostelium album PN500]|uniref:alpha-mannosidase n=1 Tax=Heterostelium pallidum (strain ATCC 26659 / Pp 5 / PN500) TaxID=670386 RepID=D3BM45_HETP5|nr:alpha-mannosidase [Heterostelium album PN500]EFA77646.1 alpha-mannosidase [Heterostelium album PN500]|eukprot:XP_020429774.1 alpha-mannosidase [Heterostelium album PN500]
METIHIEVYINIVSFKIDQSQNHLEKMGKRKSAKPPPKKKIMTKLPKYFDCPFCDHTQSVECTLKRETQVGTAKCRSCQSSYSTKINELSDPIDIYTDWIDACEMINKPSGTIGVIFKTNDHNISASWYLLRQRKQNKLMRRWSLKSVFLKVRCFHLFLYLIVLKTKMLLLETYRDNILRMLAFALIGTLMFTFYLNNSSNNNSQLTSHGAFRDGVNKIVQTEISPATILLVPHSHCDAGWLQTFEEYYDNKVYSILDSVISELKKDHSKRFIWSEISFFRKWWDNQKQQIKDSVHDLVESGRFEFIGGGWVQNDEAVSNIDDVMDQITEGHIWIAKHFNRTVEYGWQIDPFGHSSLTPTLFAQLGFKAMIGNRITDKAKEVMRDVRQLDFIWEGSALLADKSRMFVHLLNYHYGYPSQEIYNTEEPYAKFLNNVETYAKAVHDLIARYRDATLSNIVMIPWGDDFTYADAEDEFKRADTLIDLLNDDKEKRNIKEIRYATLSEYFELLFKDIKERSLPLPLFKNDFFPYVTKNEEPWTGFYSSHTLLKKEIRETSTMVRSADIFYSLAVAKSSSKSSHLKGINGLAPGLEEARHNLAITQHHDSVTGTARSYVMNDYYVKLQKARESVESVLVNSIEYLRVVNTTVASDNNDGVLEIKNVLDINWMSSDTKKGGSYALVLTNTLAWNRTGHTSIRVKGSRDKVGRIRVVEADTLSVKQTQTIPVNLQLECKNNVDEYNIYFISSVPPVGSSTYYLLLESTENKDTWSTISENYFFDTNYKLENQFLTINFNSHGFINSITRQLTAAATTTVQLNETMQQYTTMKSGAYLFIPDDKSNDFSGNSDKKKYYYITGPLLSQVLVYSYGGDVCSPKTIVLHRVYRSDSSQPCSLEKLVEVGYSVPGEGNRETVFNYQTSIKSGKKFYTDNGLESRTRSHFNDNYINFQYFPVLSSAHIKDDSLQFTIFTERSHGVTSPTEGGLEIMVHRTLMQDDWKGLSFANKDFARIDGKFYLNLDTIETATQNSKQQSLQILQPPIQLYQKFVHIDEYKLKYKQTLSFFNSSLPSNLHLYSLKFYNQYDSKGKPLIYMRIGDIQVRSDTTPQLVDYDSLFSSDLTVSNMNRLGLNFLPYKKPYASEFKSTKKSFVMKTGTLYFCEQGASEHQPDLTDDLQDLDQDSSDNHSYSLSPLEIKSYGMTLSFGSLVIRPASINGNLTLDNLNSNGSSIITTNTTDDKIVLQLNSGEIDDQLTQELNLPFPFMLVGNPHAARTGLNKEELKYPYDFSVYKIDLAYNNDSGRISSPNYGLIVGVSFFAFCGAVGLVLLVVTLVRRRMRRNVEPEQLPKYMNDDDVTSMAQKDFDTPTIATTETTETKGKDPSGDITIV